MGRLPPCAGLAATRARFARTCDIADIVCLRRIAFALRLALAQALLFTHLLAHLGNQVFTQGVIGGAEGLPPVGDGFVHLAH